LMDVLTLLNDGDTATARAKLSAILQS